MNIRTSCKALMVTAVILLLLSAPAWGQRGHRDRDRDWDHDRSRSGAFERGRKDFMFDRRHHHNRYYPRRGHVVPKLPRSYRVFRHRDRKFFFNGGVWYRSSGSRFVVVRPPIGLTVPFLPSFYTTVWVGGMPYYYAGGVYYVWQPERRVYVVTEPPRDSEIIEEEATPEELFIYPGEGQSEDQQATDRYECHSWASEQTGFDPTQPGGNVPLAEYSGKQADYQRAMKACLEARGYSVK